MYSIAKFANLLLAVVAFALSAQAAVVARAQLAELSVIFWDNTNLTGASYSPDSVVQTVCSTLPGDWLDRAESVQIASGFSCTFFGFEGCEGDGTVLSGIVDSLPASTLFDNTESFSCNKQT